MLIKDNHNSNSYDQTEPLDFSQKLYRKGSHRACMLTDPTQLTCRDSKILEFNRDLDEVATNTTNTNPNKASSTTVRNVKVSHGNLSHYGSQIVVNTS